MEVEGNAFRRRPLIASRILAEQQLQLQRQAVRRQTLVALIRNQIAQQLAFCLYLAVFRKPNRALARREPRMRVRAAGLQRLLLHRHPFRLYLLELLPSRHSQLPRQHSVHTRRARRASAADSRAPLSGREPLRSTASLHVCSR